MEEEQSNSVTDEARGDLAGDTPAAVSNMFWRRPYRGDSEARREGDDLAYSSGSNIIGIYIPFGIYIYIPGVQGASRSSG